MNDKERKNYSLIFLTKKEKIHTLFVFIVLLMGWGPGAVIANKHQLMAGIPMLWLWWLCWFVLWCVAKYFLMFKSGGNMFED